MSATLLTGLVTGLVDDAGVFPPERLAMAAALARHAADAAAGSTVLTHRFLCPTSRIREALALLGPGQQLDLAVVADTGLDGMGAVLTALGEDRRVRLAAVELRWAPDDHGGGLDRLAALIPVGVRVWVEPGWEPGLPDRLAGLDRDLRAAGLTGGAKLRCGGVRQDLFPAAAELAAALSACARAGLAWKATAGLHRAVRYTDPATGLRHHGFLNLLVAAGRATQRSDLAGILAALETDDAADLVREAQGWDGTTTRRARAAFVSYGSCSTQEPLAELAALGLTATPAAR